jgi:putative membrane protein
MKIIKTFPMLGAAAMACSMMISQSVLAQQNTKLSDPEVAHVAVTANQIDINYAQIAKKRSKNTEILNFAKTMANDHQSVINTAAALVKKLGVTPKDNAMSKKLLADAAKTKKALEAAPKKTFDKAYIDNEVAYHKAVINAVENVLIPDAENQELKALLQNVVPTLKAHLAHAEMVQGMIK